MQNLTEKDYEIIRKTINKYHKLGITWEPGLEEKLGHAFAEAFKEFASRCVANKTWRQAYTFMRDYREVTKFNMDTNFEITLGDSDFKYKVYSDSIHREYVNAYDHLNDYRKEINGKISKIDGKRFAIGKKMRINYLQNKLRSIENEANLYAYWKQKDELKNDYLANKTDAYNLERAKFNQVETKIATAIIANTLKHKAILAYHKLDQILSTSYEFNDVTYEINSQIFNQVCNQIRQTIMEPQTNETDNTLSY